MSEVHTELTQQRQLITELLQTQNYPTDLFSQLWQNYQQHLVEYCEQQRQDADFESILADNLQWVKLITEQITSERDAVAEAVLRLQKGKKAQQSYGENN